jgi:CheY-like chemotaxis protein
MSILVCEDNTLASLVISTILKRQGYDIVTAADGSEAIDKVSQGNPDLVISDIHLPYHSGLEVVRYMRTDLGRKTPVIIVSAFSDPHVQEQARVLGISDYFVKPIDTEILVKRVASLVK